MSCNKRFPNFFMNFVLRKLLMWSFWNVVLLSKASMQMLEQSKCINFIQKRKEIYPILQTIWIFVVTLTSTHPKKIFSCMKCYSKCCLAFINDRFVNGWENFFSLHMEFSSKAEFILQMIRTQPISIWKIRKAFPPNLKVYPYINSCLNLYFLQHIFLYGLFSYIHF